MTGVIKDLLFISPKRKILYVTDVFSYSYSPTPTNKFEHLSCFLPGLLALGVHSLGDELPPGERTLHLAAAEGLAYSCWLMYAEGPRGLAPDEVMFERMERGRMRPCGRSGKECWPNTRLARPVGRLRQVSPSRHLCSVPLNYYPLHQEKPICLAMANMYFFTKKWPGMAFLACLLDNVSQIHESHAMTRLHFSRSFS